MTQNEVFNEATPRLRQFVVSLDEFEQGKSIGEGAFGKVYLGVHRPTGTECAIKILLAQKLEERDKVELLRESSVMAEVSDLFVLPFIGWTATYPYSIITQYVPGGCLFDALRGKKGTVELTPTNKTIIMIGIAKGMHALHKKKIIHRDLKSLNVLLDEKCFPKICDFGLSVIDSEMSLKTTDIGTPHWMAPELFETNDYTNKVDVYAYGILMWEILTGSTPYKGKTAVQIAVAVCQHGERPKFPKDTPKALSSFINSCWHQNPAKRPSFSQIVQLLNKRTIIFPGTDENELDFFFHQIEEDAAMRKMGVGVGVKPLGNPLFIASMNKGSSQGNATPNEPNPAELGNPNYQYYESNLKLCIKMYTAPDSIKQFFDMLVPAVVNDHSDVVTNFILNQCARLIVKEDYMFNAFFSSKLFGSMPTKRRDCAGAVFNILHVYVSRRPDLLSKEILGYYSPLTEFAPHKMLKIVIMNLERFGELANGWDLCAYAFYIAPTLIRSDAGGKYIQFLMEMLKKHQQFCAQYISTCIQIFIAAVQQYKPEVSNTAYAAIISLNSPGVTIAPEVIANSLRAEECAKGGLAYLLAVQNTPLTPVIIDLLFSLSTTFKEAMALLLVFAERQDSFINYFPEYQGRWLVDGRLSLESSVQVMALMMCHKEFRPYIAHVVQLMNWLCMLVQSLTISTIGFSAMLLNKIGMTRELIPYIKNSGYFRTLIDAVISLKDQQLFQSTICLIDTCSRLDYIDDFNKFDIKLIEIALSKVPKISLGSISALAMRSIHPQGAANIKSLGYLANVINEYSADQQALPFLKILHQNCS